jgi:hypothetical protein
MNFEKINNIVMEAILEFQSQETKEIVERSVAVGKSKYVVPSPAKFGFKPEKPEKSEKPKKRGRKKKAKVEAPKPAELPDPEDVKLKSEEDYWEEDEKAQEYLTTHAEKSKKKSAWWLPPHNVMFNKSLMGFNFWTFGYRVGFRTDDDGNPIGITLKPGWHPMGSGGLTGASTSSGFHLITRKMAKKMLESARKMPSIQDSVKETLELAEKRFKTKIPTALKNKIIKDSVKVAIRRMDAKGADPEYLYPFDGSKPRKLRMWEDKEQELMRLIEEGLMTSI